MIQTNAKLKIIVGSIFQIYQIPESRFEDPDYYTLASTPIFPNHRCDSNSISLKRRIHILLIFYSSVVFFIWLYEKVQECFSLHMFQTLTFVETYNDTDMEKIIVEMEVHISSHVPCTLKPCPDFRYMALYVSASNRARFYFISHTWLYHISCKGSYISV